MEHFSASTFHNISKLIQTAYCHYRRSQKSGLLQVPGRAISDNEKTDLWRMYDEIEGHCKEIRLLASVQCAKRLKQEFANSAVDADGKILVYPVQAAIDASHAAYRIEELDNRIIEEMQTKLFLHILPHRLKFFTDIERMYPGEMEQLASLLGEEVYGLSKQLSNFQNASFDLFEAGNCFACERYTACVHHLSKVVEFGLGGSSGPRWRGRKRPAKLEYRTQRRTRQPAQQSWKLRRIISKAERTVFLGGHRLTQEFQRRVAQPRITHPPGATKRNRRRIYLLSPSQLSGTSIFGSRKSLMERPADPFLPRHGSSSVLLDVKGYLPAARSLGRGRARR